MREWRLGRLRGHVEMLGNRLYPLRHHLLESVRVFDDIIILLAGSPMRNPLLAAVPLLTAIGLRYHHRCS